MNDRLRGIVFAIFLLLVFSRIVSASAIDDVLGQNENVGAESDVVENHDPAAMVLVESSVEGVAPFTVSLTASGSSDPDGDPLSYRWVASNGATAEGEEAQFVFDAQGSYSVTLTVDDGRGGSDQAVLSPIVVSASDETESEAPADGLLSLGSGGLAWNPASGDSPSVPSSGEEPVFRGAVALGEGVGALAQDGIPRASGEITLSGSVTPRAADVGEVADLFAIAYWVGAERVVPGESYAESCASGRGAYYMVVRIPEGESTDAWDWYVPLGFDDGLARNRMALRAMVEWTGYLSDLAFVREGVTLTRQAVELPVLQRTRIGYAGRACFTLGYQVRSSREVVFSGETLNLTVVE
ncbi:PKD domain-containing protein [Endothiovibrio diazotrophicus]